MALRLSRLFGRGGGDQAVMKDGANNVTLENDAVMKVDALSATQAGGPGSVPAPGQVWEQDPATAARALHSEGGGALETDAVMTVDPLTAQDVFVTEFTGADEEVGALLAVLQQRGLIDTSTGEVVWADEATSNLSQNEPLLDWLNANHFERGPNGIMVWNGEPVSHGLLPFIEQQNVAGPGASGLVSEVGFPPLDGAGGNAATFELTPAGSHAQAFGDSGGETQALAGDRFVAAREAGSGMATGVHDIHMNEGNTQSIQQQMQNENQRVQGPAGEQGQRKGDQPGTDTNATVDHPIFSVEEANAARQAGGSGVIDYREGGVNDSTLEPGVKWEGPDFDASKNEVAIESLEVAHEGVRGANQQGVVEDLNVKYTLLEGEDDIGLNIKTDSEVTDYAEGGTSLDDFNPKEAGEGKPLYEWIKASALPEVDDEVLVEFQSREPGRIEFPNLARQATSDTMPMEEVHFLRGTGQRAQLDDDGPSNLLGDFDGDGRVETTDAMSLNFEEIKLSAIQDGGLDETESDVLAADFDGIEIPD